MRTKFLLPLLVLGVLFYTGVPVYTDDTSADGVVTTQDSGDASTADATATSDVSSTATNDSDEVVTTQDTSDASTADATATSDVSSTATNDSDEVVTTQDTSDASTADATATNDSDTAIDTSGGGWNDIIQEWTSWTWGQANEHPYLSTAGASSFAALLGAFFYVLSNILKQDAVAEVIKRESMSCDCSARGCACLVKGRCPCAKDRKGCGCKKSRVRANKQRTEDERVDNKHTDDDAVLCNCDERGCSCLERGKCCCRKSCGSSCCCKKTQLTREKNQRAEDERVDNKHTDDDAVLCNCDERGCSCLERGKCCCRKSCGSSCCCKKTQLTRGEKQRAEDERVDNRHDDDAVLCNCDERGCSCLERGKCCCRKSCGSSCCCKKTQLTRTKRQRYRLTSDDWAKCPFLKALTNLLQQYDGGCPYLDACFNK